jgi:hypothetical protein
MFQPQIIERRRMEPARAGTHSPRTGRGRRIRAVATVVLLAVAVGVLAGFVAFRVTRDAPDRGLAADDARRPAQTGQVDQRRILSTLDVIATTAVVAMTWRRRVRSHLRERA